MKLPIHGRPALPVAFVLLLPALPGLISAQNRIGTGEVADLYQMHCASCHGDDLRGGLGGPLVGAEWDHAQNDADIARIIREGLPDLGMNPFAGTLSDLEIQALVIYIREAQQLSERRARTPSSQQDGVFQSDEHDYRLEPLAAIDGEIWGMDFLPDGGLIFTELDGPVWRVAPGEEPQRIAGTPEVFRRGQGGMLAVTLHPEYPENGWIYLGFSASTPEAPDRAMTKIVRGRIEGERWIDEEVIFEAPARFHLPTAHHFGTRIVFRDGYLFFSIGDRGRQDMAQDITVPNGKIHRLHEDGRIPGDNPFVERPDAFQSIWTFGNRNPQGIALHPATREIWAAEHGPRGGDEVNHIREGLNYGWPVITYGINYDGSPITDRTTHPEMEQPVHYWTPSIAVCGISFYTGEQFPHWKNNLFAGGLASEELHRLVIQNGTVQRDEVILRGQGRIRDVATSPDGELHVSLTPRGGGKGTIFRLVPLH